MAILVISISVAILLCVVLLKYNLMLHRLRYSEHIRKGLMQTIRNKQNRIVKIKNIADSDTIWN